MVYHSQELCLVVRAMLQHLHAFPSQRHKYETRNAIILCFGASPIAYTVCMSTIIANTKQGVFWLNVAYGLNDLLPWVLISVTQDSFSHVVSASTDLLAGIADDVQQLINKHARVESTGFRATLSAPASTKCPACRGRYPSQSSTLARGVRALRVRYQCVHDGVLATNGVYGLFNRASITVATVQVVVCLYVGVIVPHGKGK
ncbi:uncharacterized protein LOC127752227 [Frankliniella occidentalis]|uniref:Uncharacterized protein LOC127749636 n=1 Tax=Frankliniella occidentalis TaxID=133901 RepID=A0A9C6XVZ7_FRAOC|nr:uncharacterized protein LOC127749636 [Frankliniella occidentalis]XP_052132960.1 uncharacterized protein LOC127752227 [Frankliniella occidentalis]